MSGSVLQSLAPDRNDRRLFDRGVVKHPARLVGHLSGQRSGHTIGLPLPVADDGEVQVAAFERVDFKVFDGNPSHAVPLLRPSKGKGNNALTAAGVNSEKLQDCVVSRLTADDRRSNRDEWRAGV